MQRVGCGMGEQSALVRLIDRSSLIAVCIPSQEKSVAHHPRMPRQFFITTTDELHAMMVGLDDERHQHVYSWASRSRTQAKLLNEQKDNVKQVFRRNQDSQYQIFEETMWHLTKKKKLSEQGHDVSDA